MSEIDPTSSSNLSAPKITEPRGFSLPARVTVSLRAGAVLAIANVICVLIFSWAWVHVKAAPKSIQVTGSAKKQITSDLIVWQAIISADDPALPATYDQLHASLNKTLAYLKTQNIADNEITVGPINMQKHYERDAKGNNTDKISSYELIQGVTVSSGNVARVADVARTATQLISQGVLLESHPPEYLYTKLANLKIEMLADATKDARTRAEQIASNSGSTLGSVEDARMGVMQINALHSDDVSGYGVNDTTSLQKEITAVVTARFGIK